MKNGSMELSVGDFKRISRIARIINLLSRSRCRILLAAAGDGFSKSSFSRRIKKAPDTQAHPGLFIVKQLGMRFFMCHHMEIPTNRDEGVLTSSGQIALHLVEELFEGGMPTKGLNQAKG